MGLEGQRRTSLMVDPYTGEVKGLIRPYAQGDFFTFVRRLHRWFLLQVQGPGITWGKLITGTSTLVLVFILISGIIIWIPKTWSGVKKRLSIKRGAGRFRFWYDFHLSLGKISAIVLLAMALTGLTWSFNWYRNGFYKVFGVEVTQGPAQQSGGHGGSQTGNARAGERSGGRPEGTRDGDNAGTDSPEAEKRDGDHPDGLGSNRERDGELSTEERGENRGRGNRSDGSEADIERRGGRPDGERRGGREDASDNGDGERRGRGGGRHGGQRSGQSDDNRKYSVWQKAAAEVIALNPKYKAVTVQDGSISVSTNRYGNTRASDSYKFDTRTGEITTVDYYRDQPRSAKIRGWIYAVHVGSWGGIFTRIIYFIVCLIGAALPITGYYIWLKKRWKKWRRARTA